MFSEVLHKAVDVSECDRERSRRLIDEYTAREKFYYAVSVRDKAMLKQTVALMKQNGKVTPKEYLLFLKCMIKG